MFSTGFILKIISTYIYDKNPVVKGQEFVPKKMEKNITDKSRHDVPEKSHFVYSKNLEAKQEKKSLLELQNFKENAKNKSIAEKTENIIENKIESLNFKQDSVNQNISQNSDGQENLEMTKNKVLKRKLTEDRITIEKVLSEGEASSGFETVSSIDSELDIEDLDLSFSDTESNYNVIVKRKNDIAYSSIKEPDGRIWYRKDKNSSPVRRNSQSGHFLEKYISQRCDGLRYYRNPEHWLRDDKSRKCRYSRRDGWSKEKDDIYYSRRNSRNRGWSRCSDRGRRSRGSRCSDHSRGSRGSVCSDRSRSRGSKNVRMSKSRRSRSNERNNKFRGLKRPSYIEKKTDSRRSRSFDGSISNIKRNFQSRRKKFFSKSTLVWKRLDSCATGDEFKNHRVDSVLKNSCTVQSRKKERTPFLVELERKLKEAESQENLKKETANLSKDQTKTAASDNNVNPLPEMVMSQNPSPERPSAYTSTNVQGLYSVQYPTIPIFSMENLPLVPGPTGLPVHITLSGEQIPHDVDGRRIPIGPNGYYLPVDPTGRLFAHIVSPGNQAVPIHMTEDGVLRLPNSEPVPYGPSHNLPVNIDGSVILIGPDSKPLCPCPNLPRQPPIGMMQITQSNMVFMSAWPMEMQQANSVILQRSQTDVQQSPHIELQKEQSSNLLHPHSTDIDPSLLDFIQNSCTKINKADLFIKYQKKARERKEDILKCKEIEKNLGVNSSKGGIKRSIPMKLSQKKICKDEPFSDHDMVLDSGDSDSASSLKLSSKAKKDGSRVINETPFMDDPENILKSTCGDGNTEIASEDFIIKKIQHALKSLSEKNFKPPAFGRFIISKLNIESVVKTSPNVSPLLRNRVKLPFLSSGAENCGLEDSCVPVEKTAAITFKFLPEEKSDKAKKTAKSSKTLNKNSGATKFPVFTFDFAMQCDFTSVIIKSLNSKVAEMEMEVIRLRNINANLLDGFRNAQEANERKSEELGKALLEVELKNNEILTLKRLMTEKDK